MNLSIDELNGYYDENEWFAGVDDEYKKFVHATNYAALSHGSTAGIFY